MRAGAAIVGISADPLAETREWQAGEDPEDRIGFPLLSDADLRVSKAYGVHDVPHDISLPAVVLIEKASGTIRWVRVSGSVGDRPEAEEVLEQARRLNLDARPSVRVEPEPAGR